MNISKDRDQESAEQFTLLLVEDDEVHRQAMAFTFKRRGFRIFLANNGREAFEIVKQENIHVVITDVRMPGGNGIELLTRIKDHNSDTPAVIVITGFADLSSGDAKRWGADAVFSKPFDSNGLMRAVQRAVESVSTRS